MFVYGISKVSVKHDGIVAKAIHAEHNQSLPGSGKELGQSKKSGCLIVKKAVLLVTKLKKE
jgi:hypothetical protein